MYSLCKTHFSDDKSNKVYKISKLLVFKNINIKKL